MAYTQKHLNALELNKVLIMLSEVASCEDSRLACLAIEPTDSYAKAQREIMLTSDVHSLTSRFGTPTVLGMRNYKNSVKRAELGAILSPRELLGIVTVLKAIKNLSRWTRHFKEEEHAIDELFSDIVPNESLLKRIDDAIISEEEISDNASPTLRDIRRKIVNAGAKARSRLESMVKSTHYQKFLQENIITIRGDRFVLPVKSEYKNEIRGLVHDTSSSGATLFIEPIDVVEANNEVRILKGKENDEIEAILSALSQEVAEYATEINIAYDACVAADVLFAKARLADIMRASVPEIRNDASINLVKARHPLIDAKKAVPVDIHIGENFDTLVITGPNTGGKTVSIKTMGLLTVMALCGLMIPAGDNSHISVFSDVLCDIGDEQSIEQSLSTFSAHMTNIVSILSCVKENTLVLLDELGAGTDPTEGAALAVAIIKHLREKGARIAATTHYAEMKLYALETEGVTNASCEFDIASLSPTYKLLIGAPGRSNAFAISAKLGLDDNIIEHASKLVSGESVRFEKVLARLEGERKELETALKTAEEDRIESERIRKDLQIQQERVTRATEREIQNQTALARSLVERVKAEAQQMMDELVEIQKLKDEEGFSERFSSMKGTFKANMRKLEELADPVTGRVNKSNYTLPRPLKKGDLVKLVELNKEGTVLGLPDGAGNVSVQAGIVKTKVHVSQLRLVENKKKNTTTLNGGSINLKGITSSAERSTKQEINLLGLTVGEALLDLDRFIDSAVMSKYTIIYIIHGKGTGTLRKAVQTHLRSHKSIRTFRQGVYGEGESGVTVAELK